MTIGVSGTGSYTPDSTGGVHTYTSYATYSFFSGELISTDSFEDNVLDFGVPLSEVFIVNAGANPIAIQWPEDYVGVKTPANAANIASGVVLNGATVNFRKLMKRGMKIRSLTAGSQSVKVYVFGV
jgi:hypothetical protein